MARVQQHDHRADDLVVRQPAAVDSRLDERGHHVVTRVFAPFPDQLVNVLLKLRGSLVRRARSLERDLELVHLHHSVRPVEQVTVTVERHAEHAADDRDRVRLRVVVEELHLTRLGERLEQLAREIMRGLAQRLHASRRERRRNELPEARVIRRLEPEEAPALRVPERLPARVQRGHADLFRRHHVTEVATEALVTQTAPDVLVPGDEPALPPGVVEERGTARAGGSARGKDPPGTRRRRGRIPPFSLQPRPNHRVPSAVLQMKARAAGSSIALDE